VTAPSLDSIAIGNAIVDVIAQADDAFIASEGLAKGSMQLLTAGVLAVAGTMIAHRWRKRSGEPPPLAGLDVGQSVHVESWHADGTARVVYRGTRWNGVLASDATPRRHTMYIVGTRGSTLVLGAERP